MAAGAFQMNIFERRVLKEAGLDPEQDYFLDGGLHGTLAYMCMAGLESPASLTYRLKAHPGYDKVFIIGQLP